VAAQDEADRQVRIVDSRVRAAGERHHVARRNYLGLTSRAVATSKGKGKGAPSTL
jgi:hypothetical protein